MLVLTGCRRGTPAPAQPTTPTATAGSGRSQGAGRGLLAPATPGVRFRLSDAQPPEATPATRSVQAPATPLGAERVAELVGGLPDLPTPEAPSFVPKPGPRPPPMSGQTRVQSFPPPELARAPATPEAGPLEVLRYQPEGDSKYESRLAVTFSQPMVALTTHAALAAADVPVRLSPQPKGKWRWLGTRTLLFEPEVRFPMATTYTVEVPGGVRSASGGLLPKTVSWTFHAPPPSVVSFYPTGKGVDRHPLVFVAFDQRIEPEQAMRRIAIKAASKDVPFRLASRGEVDADEQVSEMARAAEAGRWLALYLEQELAKGAAVDVQIGPHVPSAEGPETSGQPENFEFSVYEPLSVTGIACGDQHEAVDIQAAGASISGCEPLSQWSIGFNNPLAGDSVGPEALEVAPMLDELEVEVFGGQVIIAGVSHGRSEYTVRVKPSIRDTFGQTLGQAAVLTFATGAAPSAMYAPDGDMLVLDPSAPAGLDLATVNSRPRLRLYRVEPEDWAGFRNLAGSIYDVRRRVEPPGRLAHDEVLKPQGEPDALIITRVDLSPALTDGLGQVVVVVEHPDWRPRSDNYRIQPIYRWVQVTRLGLDAFAEDERLLAWVTSLSDGRAAPGVSLSLLKVLAEDVGGAYPSYMLHSQVVAGPAAQRTDRDGLAAIELRALSEGERLDSNVLVARKDGDTALLIDHSATWWRKPPRANLAWYVFDDRGIYQPGEEVHVKGWVRRLELSRGGDTQALGRPMPAVNYSLTTYDGQPIRSGRLETSIDGGLHGSFTLPNDVSPGMANLSLTMVGVDPQEGGQFSKQLHIAEYRRPEFEVSATADQPYYFYGQRAVVTARAAYYAGGGLANAETRWTVTGRPTTFTPPGRDDFVFGSHIPWWRRQDEESANQSVQSHTARTDSSGRHYLAIDIEGAWPVSPVSIEAQAEVMDVNRQAWSAEASTLVHPASHYVGLRTDAWFVGRNDGLSAEAIVTDLDGKLVAGSPISVTAERVKWDFERGQYVERREAAGGCDLTSDRLPVACRLNKAGGGQYRLTASITDQQGRPNMTELTLYVWGGDGLPGPHVAGQRAELIPAAREYRPGDMAEILVQAPFAPAEGLLSVRRSGIVHVERFRMQQASHTLRVPISAEHYPGVTVQVDLVGTAPREVAQAGLRPAFAVGLVELAVPPLERTLRVSARPRQAVLEPAGRTRIDVEVRDASGAPLRGAEVALVVADEAVLALTDYDIPDPLTAFYPPRDPGVSDSHQRELTLLKLDVTSAANGIGGGPAADMSLGLEGHPALRAAAVPTRLPTALPPEEPATQFAERRDLNPLAAFEPVLVTDSRGQASVEVQLPDNITRYRMSAVATDGAQRFGKGESALTARLPLMVRPSAPRFLNFGDEFELPIIVQNQTDQSLEADVVVRTSNLKLSGPAGLRVSVPGNDRVEVRFAAETVLPGAAFIQSAAVAGNHRDAQRVGLTVWTPATTETFATYGEVDRGAVVQPVERPPDVLAGFGGLDVTTSSTALSQLTDAFLYLHTQPYEGAEQIASRLVATVALRDVLEAFDVVGLPPPSEVEASIRRDIDRLVGLQNQDGGYGWWTASQGSSPFASVHVGHALARAKARHHALPEATRSRVHDYLRSVDWRLTALGYGRSERQAVDAYALFVRLLFGDRDTQEAERVFRLDPEPHVETLGWLLHVLTGQAESARTRAEIARRLANRVTEEAGTARCTTQYTERDTHLLLASDRRADAVVLEALIADQPESDLIPKLVRGLLARRVAGRWGSTQENASVLLALDRYFRTYEAQTPDFLARAWLGDTYVGQSEFRGRSPDRGLVEIPMNMLPSARRDLILTKSGAGRLYYRLGLRYSPSDLELEPAEHGFSVERTYEALDKPTDVQATAEGGWRIRAGARVRVRLSLVAPTARYHVALVDPLPAGLEALNPDLAVVGQPPEDEPAAQPEGYFHHYFWDWTWYVHQAMRNERVEVFADALPGGVYEYSYVARATTPGSFIVPPAKAEELYEPETFGRGKTDRVEVVP